LSSLSIKDCKFKNNFTIHNGGNIYIYDSYSFDAENIESFNTTAIQKVLL